MRPERSFRIEGIVPIIPTPFSENEEIHWDSLGHLIDFACEAEACAICLPAYASEFYKLTDEERRQTVARAITYARGRIPVIAQVNHPSARQVVESASCAKEAGAAAIAVAVPRLFPLAEQDLYRYFARILTAVELPLIIQDFNPGGSCITPQFIGRLHGDYPHFRYVKLEEPGMAAKVKAIRQECRDEVGVLEGWGGMYVLELTSAGICGVVPGLALTDILAHVFRLAHDGQIDAAYEIFQCILPQIVFSLQNLELFHHAEKLLLQDRGVLQQVKVRDAGLQLSPEDERYIRLLNRKILALLDRLKLPHNFAVAPSKRKGLNKTLRA